MKKVICSFLVISGTLATLSSAAQLTTVNNATTKANQKVAEVNATASNISSTVTDAVTTATTVKNAATVMKDMFGGKKDKVANMVHIVISGVTYEDANLNLLKEKLENAKGIKAVKSSFADDVATISIQVKSKVTPDDIWQSVPADVRAAFDMKAMDETNITLARKKDGKETVATDN